MDQRRYARAIVAFALLTLASLTLPIELVARRALREVAQRSRLERGFRAEREYARTDPLTGAANRRAFEVALRACHAALAASGRPFVLAIVDIDRFKQLNDTHGHSVGDAALKRIARTLLGGVRRSDMVARLGGDEFAVLMPAGDAWSMRRPFDAMFTALTVAVAGAGWPISFSIGVIAFEGPIAQPQDATALADKLMYEVKASGRNGVRYAVYREQRLHPDVGGADASGQTRAGRMGRAARRGRDPDLVTRRTDTSAPARCHAIPLGGETGRGRRPPPTARSRARTLRELTAAALRRRLPVAAASALATAGAIGGTPGSPTPVGLAVDGTMCTSTVGISLMRSTG